MPKFEVLITETLAKSVIVEAENEDAAFRQVRRGWENENYVLYPEDFVDVEFETRLAGESGGYETRYDVKGNIRPGRL